MTSVLEAMAALRSEERRAPASAATPPPASEEAIRLALQLRDIASREGGRVVLFVPGSRHGEASPAVGDAACGLLALHDGPVLIMDLRDHAEAAATPKWINALVDDDELRLVGDEAGRNTAALLRPLAGRPNQLQYASSSEFVSSVVDVRARYPYVLCIGEAAPRSVPTLMMAGLADGVVLAVPPGQTTRSEMHEVTAKLQRARAKLLGFVVDPRGTPRKGER